MYSFVNYSLCEAHTKYLNYVDAQNISDETR